MLSLPRALPRMSSFASFEAQKTSLTPAPSSIHTVAVQACSTRRSETGDESAPVSSSPAHKRLLRLLKPTLSVGASVFICWFQCAVVANLLFGIENNSCKSNASCQRGAYCRQDLVRARQVCESCDLQEGWACFAVNWTTAPSQAFHVPGDEAEALLAYVPGSSGHGHRKDRHWYFVADAQAVIAACDYLSASTACASDVDYTGYFNVATPNRCRACIEREPFGYGRKIITFSENVRSNVASMIYCDWITFAFASLLLAYHCAIEVHQIRLTNIMLLQQACHPICVIIIRLNNVLREFVMLPILMACTPTLVACRGTNGFESMLSVLRIYFILAVDDLAFAAMVPLPTKNELKMHGLIHLQPVDHAYLRITSWLTVTIIPVLCCVKLGELRDDEESHSPVAYLYFLVEHTMVGAVAALVAKWRSGRSGDMNGWGRSSAYRAGRACWKFAEKIFEGLFGLYLTLILAPVLTNHYVAYNGLCIGSEIFMTFEPFVTWAPQLVDCSFAFERTLVVLTLLGLVLSLAISARNAHRQMIGTSAAQSEDSAARQRI